MTLAKRLPVTKAKKYHPNLWFERLMALIAVLNLLLVLFDLSYIPLRDFWLHGTFRLGELKAGWIELPGFKLDIIPQDVSQYVTQYDQVKGIVPHRDTQQYLATVDELEQALEQEGINSSTVTALLQDLRRRSVEMIETNPFALANKSGILEQIKNRIREHHPNVDNSAKEAFAEFWSRDNFRNENQIEAELQFFDRELRPLIETNYFRPIDENGLLIDYFGFIDFPFGVIFALEFLARTWYISRSRTGVSWLDAVLWRWYDLFFLLPFWRWLRVIPVTIRFNQAQIIDLSSVQKQLSQGLVAGIAEDVTEVVVVRVINQMQGSIRQGDFSQLLSQHSVNAYIDINNTNELAEIVKLVSQLFVYQVLPQIRPEAEALLQYSLEKALKQSPAYQGIKLLPGGDRTITSLSEQLVKQSYQAFTSALGAALEEDQKFEELLKSLFDNISQSFTTEIKAKQSITKIEVLLIDLLEEIKINYVQRLSTEDVEEILEQTRSLRQIAKT